MLWQERQQSGHYALTLVPVRENRVARAPPCAVQCIADLDQPPDAFQITMEWMAALQVAVPVCRGASGVPGQLPQISWPLKVIQPMYSTMNVSNLSVSACKL